VTAPPRGRPAKAERYAPAVTARRRGRPIGRTKAETRAAILTAGRVCFGKYGYDAATNRMVADAAGVSAGAIYQHFRAKRDLYRAVSDDARERTVDAFTSRASTTDDVRSAMLTVLDMSRQLHSADPSFAHFTVSYPVEVRRHDELSELPINFVEPRELRSILERAGLRRDVRAGVSPKDAADALYLLLMGLARLAQAARDAEEYVAANKVCELLFVTRHRRRTSTHTPVRPARTRRRSPRSVAPATTRQRLIDAAVTCFAEAGYTSTTLNEIAERAGLTTGAVYGNFGSKRELFVAAVQETASLVEMPIVDAVTRYDDANSRVVAYIETMVELSRTMPTVAGFRSVVPVEIVRSPELSEGLGDEYGSRLAFCRQLLEGASMKDALLGRDDLARVLSIIGDSVSWYSSLQRPVRVPVPALELLLSGKLLES
jgi:AcrR family transcriptional regulator